MFNIFSVAFCPWIDFKYRNSQVWFSDFKPMAFGSNSWKGGEESNGLGTIKNCHTLLT